MHAIGNLTAITLERAHAQDVATRAEAARQSEELKSTMLDALAHEFKTPLTPIKAAVTSMLSDSDMNPTRQELLRIVDEETDRLNSMLTEAIQMSRIEAGQLQLHRSPQSLSKIVQAQLEKLGESLEGRKVTCGGSRKFAPCECRPGIHRNRDLAVVKQCLEVHTTRAAPLPSAPAREIRKLSLALRTAGRGFPNRNNGKVFEKFYRGKDQRERIPGTGMGLTIAREIVRAHHGRIWVESEPGKGARFSFSVPRAPRESLL